MRPVVFTAWYVLVHWFFMGTNSSSFEQSKWQTFECLFQLIILGFAYWLWSATPSEEGTSLGAAALTVSLTAEIVWP